MFDSWPSWSSWGVGLGIAFALLLLGWAVMVLLAHRLPPGLLAAWPEDPALLARVLDGRTARRRKASRA